MTVALDHLTGPTVVRLMRANRLTIRALARKAGHSQDRVRKLRSDGVRGDLDAWGWGALITGNQQFGWADVTRAYL